MPAIVTRTTTSPSRGTGSATSVSRTSPAPWNTAARMAARSDGRRLELERVAVGIVAQHLDAPARLGVLDVLDPLALERGLHRLVVGHLQAGVATERADGRAGAGRLHLRLDDVDLGKDARRAEPVATRRERRARQHLESKHPAIEVLRPLRVGGRDALVLDADHVRSRHRSNRLS